MRCLAVLTLITTLFTAPASLATELGPVFGIGRITFDGPPGADPSMGDGLAGMIGGDLFNQTASGGAYEDCEAAVTDLKMRGAVLQEQALQQTEYFDPATRVDPGHLIEPTHIVSGHLHLEGGRLSWFIELREADGGEVVGTVTGEAAEDDYLDLSEQIAKEIAEDRCKKAWIASGGGRIAIEGFVPRLDAPFNLTGAFKGGNALFRFVPGGETGGSVSYVAQGSGVTGSGAGTYTLARMPDGSALITSTTNGCVDGIAGSCMQNTEKIVLTPVKR